MLLTPFAGRHPIGLGGAEPPERLGFREVEQSSQDTGGKMNLEHMPAYLREWLDSLPLLFVEGQRLTQKMIMNYGSLWAFMGVQIWTEMQMASMTYAYTSVFFSLFFFIIKRAI